MSFRPLNDLELSRLTAEELIGYVAKARDARDGVAAHLALQVLVFGLRPVIQQRVRLQMKRKESAQAVEEVVDAVFLSALAAQFDGSSVGAFRSLLNTIIKRRVADHYRRGRVDEVPLIDEHGDDENVKTPTGVQTPDDTEAVHVQACIDDVLEDLSEPHQLVVHLRTFAALSSIETAAEVKSRLGEEMTVANVDQITHRFRQRLKQLLDGETGS